MGEIQTHVTSLSGGQENFTMWLGLKLETAKLLPLRNKLVRIFQNVRLNLMVALMIHFLSPMNWLVSIQLGIIRVLFPKV